MNNSELHANISLTAMAAERAKWAAVLAKPAARKPAQRKPVSFFSRFFTK